MTRTDEPQTTSDRTPEAIIGRVVGSMLALRTGPNLHAENVVAEILTQVDLLRQIFAEQQGALQSYMNAQCRMLERWSESDDDVRAKLWADLHMCEEPARAVLNVGTRSPEDLFIEHAHDGDLHEKETQ